MTGKEFEAIQKNAEWGDANAQCILGICYYNGDGVEIDQSKAACWYEKAAEQGNAAARKVLEMLKKESRKGLLRFF